MSTIGHYDLVGLSLLLVDESLHMRRIIRSILTSLGVKNIREAVDPSADLREAQDPYLDLIICSWLIDVIDGPEFVKLIRGGANSNNPYIPIIMMSAFTERFRVVAARDAGVNEFLAKLVSPLSLYQRIVTMIEKPQPLFRNASFFGPCRRRQALGPPDDCGERRRADPKPDIAKSEKLQDVAQG